MDLDMQKRIASNLKQLRMVYGYTQAEVAERLHICRSTYTLYELGRKLPSMDLLVDLASFYDIRLDTFIEGKTEFYIQKTFSQNASREEVAHLIETYYMLTPRAQGKLLERAEILLEKENMFPAV